MNIVKIVGSVCASLLVASIAVIVPDDGSIAKAEAPIQVEVVQSQSYVVPEDVALPDLSRASYAATTAEEVAQIRAEREAAEKAAAEQEAAKKRQQQSTSSSGWVPQYVAPDPGSAQSIAYDMVMARGWGQDEFSCLVALWNKESGWRVNAHNKSSGAYGIPQSLPGNKMASAGADWETNPATQITWGLNYISGRYGTPCGAWGHSQRTGWY